ncbi:unnamed protein product, partial [Mesorhabditis belari]|uniref:Glycosyltransferase family 92 protein n=1 Tax=Mesorhabditis belari TaxID=2138241 RepID=A0AAF3JC35_9BILA
MVYWGEAPDTVTVFHEDVSVEVKLHRAPSPSMYTNDISVCVGPMHWFNDWPRLIVFAEYLKSQGIKKFLLHVQSVSKTAKKVLDYYEKEGFLEVRGWPLLPFNKYWNPNLYTYNVAHHREMYDCGFWSASKWTFYGDLDDLPYIREKRGINIPKEEALYLHMRANFDWDPNVTRIENRKYMDVKFFEEKAIDEKLEEIRERIREILREEKPEYRGFEVMAAMDRCVKRLKQEDEPFNRTECWNPGAPCFGDIYPLDEWVLAKPEENNKFHIL